jgi:hypothetical protein
MNYFTPNDMRYLLCLLSDNIYKVTQLILETTRRICYTILYENIVGQELAGADSLLFEYIGVMSLNTGKTYGFSQNFLRTLCHWKLLETFLLSCTRSDSNVTDAQVREESPK